MPVKADTSSHLKYSGAMHMPLLELLVLLNVVHSTLSIVKMSKIIRDSFISNVDSVNVLLYRDKERVVHVIEL